MDNQQLSEECIIIKKLTIEEFQNKVNIAHPKEKIKILKYTKYKEDAEAKCLLCNSKYIKKAYNFSDPRKISICKKCFPTQPNQKKQNFIPPKGYQLIEEYKGMHKKILTKCLSCGFIWKIQPSNLKQGKGCPKCNRNISKGEKKISKWLKDNKISYIEQYPIEIKGHKLFIDFYLPKQDLYIEFQGIQHYQSVKYFGGEEKLKNQQRNDDLKRKFLKNKLLEISYLQINEIEDILKSSTTISKESSL